MNASIAYDVEKHICKKARPRKRAYRDLVPIKRHVLTKAEFKRRLMKDLCIAEKE